MNFILLAIVTLVTYMIVSRNIFKKLRMPFNIPMPGEKSVEGGTPVMYGRDSCPYTVKMKDQLNDDGVMNNFEYVDVTTAEGSKRFKEEGGEGVPYFKHNGRIAVGHMPTSKLFKMLNM